ncbi:MAG: ATP-binding protein [Clostridia bacterium]|nr:ATP-binding protein [Clostridia bacterium]
MIFTEIDNDVSEIPYSYIGLNKQSGNLFKEIENQFCDSFSNCMINARKKKLWLNAIKTLKSDPTFNDIAIDSVVSTILSDEKDKLAQDKTESIREKFSTLSSGHKVVLLIITCCVDKIVEKSIVFIDEPENHLHPPLLSALIRALSDLLMDRNGVAIISTHSPVVLQEVPSSCVWALRRSDEKIIAERLENQTFGASIGSLTNEVFKLEVTNSGFHKLLSEAVYNSGNFGDYDIIASHFDNQLGNEAAILLRTLLALHKNEEN